MASLWTKLTRQRSTGRKPWNSGHGTEWWLIVVGAVIGALTGLGAIAFDKALEYVDERVMHAQHEASWLLIATPVVGMALTGVLIRFFASEAQGHGVPQVMNALIKRGGIIRWPIGVVKVIASILTVGSGGSAGTEGPVVQIGATVGSVVGQRLHMTREHMGTLVGCGAAAGISSIFNAPIAGVFFVLEILLRDFSVKAFAPIVVASVFSQATTQAVLGENHAIFATPGDLHGYTFSILELPGFVLLGAVCGLVAVAFNKLLHKGEDLYDEWKIHPLLKPITGGLALGLMGYGFVLALNAMRPESGASVPMFYGNGYATIRELLDPNAYDTGSLLATSVVLLSMIVLLKMLGTVFTLASGGSGGVFAPSLFLGAVAGAALGVALERVGLMPEGGSPAAYALVGMAAVVAGTTHATLTSILILFELTRNVYVLLPILRAAFVARVVASVLEGDSIYTFTLWGGGVLL
ncbi:MAG: chloride channel protein, partial [Phycisphaerales bacterium JB058]